MEGLSRPVCTEKVINRAGARCTTRAKYAYAAPFDRQGFVCGNHARSWFRSVLFELVPLETRS